MSPVESEYDIDIDLKTKCQILLFN